MDIISLRYLIEISATTVHVFELITLELGALIAAWLSENKVMFRLETLPSKASHLSLTELTVALSIMSLQVHIEMPRFESLLIVPRLASSLALQLPGIPLCTGDPTIWISYRYTILSKYLRLPYTVLEFITLELRVMKATWRSENMVTFRLGTLQSPIILVAATTSA